MADTKPPYVFYLLVGSVCLTIIAIVILAMSSHANDKKAPPCKSTSALKAYIRKAVDTLRSNIDTVLQYGFLEQKPQNLIASYPFYVEVLKLGSYLYRNKCFARQHVHDACMELYGPELDTEPEVHANSKTQGVRYLLIDLHNAIDYYFAHAEHGLADIL